MDTNEHINVPNNSQSISFSDLPPEYQQQILAYVLQGKPRNPNTVQQAKSMLEADPDTVASIAEKLGIDDGNADDQQAGDEDNG